MRYTFNDTIVILNYLEYIFYQLSTFTKSELSCRKILLFLSFQRLLSTWSDFAQEMTYLNSCLVYYFIFVCLFVYYFKSSWRDIFQSFSFSGYTGLAQKFLWDFSSVRCYRKTQMNFLANQINLLSGSYKMLRSDLNLFFFFQYLARTGHYIEIKVHLEDYFMIISSSYFLKPLTELTSVTLFTSHLQLKRFT